MRKSFMRNLGLTGLTAALLLTGCAGTSSGNKTQEITDTTITASEAQSQEGSQSALNTSDDASGTDGALSSDTSSEGQKAAASQAASQTSLSDIVTGDQAKDEETYYQVKAEKDAVEIDIENLEASFRIGTISQEDFTSQKADLKTQEDYLDAQEEILEDSLDLAYRKSNPALPEGTAEELFSAEMSMTRGMFVTVLGRLEGMDPQRYTAQSFEDVASGVWYAPYVEWAIRNGVISGYGNGKFGPNDPITREQMAVILYNYAGSIDQNVGTVGDLSGFSDQEQVSGWARTQMAWAVGCGLINGKSGGALDPAGRATRSEVAAILERFVGCVLTGYTDSDGGRS